MTHASAIALGDGNFEIDTLRKVTWPTVTFLPAASATPAKRCVEGNKVSVLVHVHESLTRLHYMFRGCYARVLTNDAAS